jgi:hypothetical protein
MSRILTTKANATPIRKEQPIAISRRRRARRRSAMVAPQAPRAAFF